MAEDLRVMGFGNGSVNLVSPEFVLVKTSEPEGPPGFRQGCCHYIVIIPWIPCHLQGNSFVPRKTTHIWGDWGISPDGAPTLPWRGLSGGKRV